MCLDPVSRRDLGLIWGGRCFYFPLWNIEFKLFLNFIKTREVMGIFKKGGCGVWEPSKVQSCGRRNFEKIFIFPDFITFLEALYFVAMLINIVLKLQTHVFLR